MKLPPMTKTYAGRTVLDVPEIELTDGAVHAVIGANGSGKSTLARLAAGAIRPDDGRDARPARAGYMPQRSYAFHMSALSNLRLTGADRARAQAQLETFGLGALARQKAPSLSGGETERLALARLLMEDYPLLILDEPTNHLDLIYQKQIFALIGQWLQTPGRAVVSVVHDLSLARAFGTDALLMDSGRKIALGRANDVLTPAKLDRVYGMDVAAWMRGLYRQWAE